MLQTEFVKNLNCNYERILLDQKPEENRYQYCIVTRGGIRGLLPCSLRYINGLAYLYYDISSTQSVAQLYAGRCIKRQWMKDFLWGMRRIKQEMERFLLDAQNLLWFPEQVFQDLEKNEFYFLYLPYYEEAGGFQELMDFLVERIDYEDEVLVECVYRMHEQYELLGEIYLTEQIYEDGRILDTPLNDEKLQIPEHVKEEIMKEENRKKEKETGNEAAIRNEKAVRNEKAIRNEKAVKTEKAIRTEKTIRTEKDMETEKGIKNEREKINEEEIKDEKDMNRSEDKDAKRGIRYFFEGRMKKQREEREQLQRQTSRTLAGYAVCEDTIYTESPSGSPEIDMEEEETELGRTVYLEESAGEKQTRRLYSPEGKIIFQLNTRSVILGKKREEADCILEDLSVSRVHARITEEEDGYYLEDLNSTNGTLKNGLRLQPYEKRKLEKGDEIGLGKVTLIFR